MTAKETRQTFLDFFKEKEHLIVDSAPLLPKGDATLMFINSGMAQFKDFFLGNGTPPSPRIADTQKCLRVSGKHNDLDDVGIDTYHHTFFEMLGNWSFGNYFKKEALPWAWELLTEVYKLPKDRLYVTVFEGDKGDNLPMDEESFGVWKEILGGDERILYGNKKDNFWEMGEVGPCGPSSEIHIDLRSEEERKKVDGKTLVNEDHPQVIEIWNNVFMEFERKANGSLVKLPAKHVDTGMGFERLVRAIENKSSNYDTDVFRPLIQKVESISELHYGKKEQTDIAIRVVVDHIRAIAFVIADGQLPSNNKQGYVVRRILRRAVRYGYTYLNLKEPFLHLLVPVLAEQFEDTFPELKAQQDFVSKVIKEEEISFLRTLENGIKRFEELKVRTSSLMIQGKDVFELYDTYGFPVDLTELMARESNMEVDKKGFEKALAEQRKRSQKDAASEKSDWQEVGSDASLNVDFLGYDTLESTARVVKWREINQKGKTFYQIVLDQTPFYAESGGQVGDRGYLESPDGTKTSVVDTQKENDLIVHITKKLPTDLDGSFKAIVSQNLRSATENNHSATHLLHSALREVLGDHVQQRGSLVSEDVLRFDFSHFAKLTDEEIEQIESLVNQKVRENIKLQEMRNTPIEEAKKMGAMALFGEKYGDMVRVVMFDKDYSVELCGGTHVPATGKIGFFKITNESSVAAGIRRVEALTGEKAYDWIQNQSQILRELKDILKGNRDVREEVKALIEQNNQANKKLEELQNKEAQQTKIQLLENIKDRDGVQFLAQKVSLPSADALKNIAFELKNQVDNLFAVLAADIDGKPQIAVMISDNLVKEKDLHAGKIVKGLAKNIKGGGGGQPFFATAGGKDLSGLDKVVKEAEQVV